MYKVIGADGKEYGPITAKQLRQWIAQGRANADTQVRLEDSPNWQALGTVAEFGEALATPPSFPNLPPPPPAAPQTSKLAIASLVLGILGITCVTAPVGLVLGIVALMQISRSQGRLKGQGIAIIGIILSAFFLLMGTAMLLPALAKAKTTAQRSDCLSNVRQLTLAAIMHAQASTNTCPPTATWNDAVQTYVAAERVFRCAAGDKAHRCHYAYNAKLDGVKLDQVRNPAQTVLIFETDGGWNVSGGSESLPRQPRHGRAVVVGFADGHVEMVMESRLSQLQWEP